MKENTKKEIDTKVCSARLVSGLLDSRANWLENVFIECPVGHTLVYNEVGGKNFKRTGNG